MGGRGNHAQGGVNPLSPGEMNGSGGSGRAQRMLLARSRPNERYTAMRVFSGSAGSMALKQFCAKWLQLYSRTSQNLRSEEHTSELQSLMRISYAVFCLKKKKQKSQNKPTTLPTYT